MTSFLSLHDAVAETAEYTLPPTEMEMTVLRNLHARTDQAHSEKVTPHAGTS